MKPTLKSLTTLWLGIAGRRDEPEALAFKVAFESADLELLDAALHELAQRTEKEFPKLGDLRSVYQRILAERTARFTPPNPHGNGRNLTREEQAAYIQAWRAGRA